MKTGKYTRAIAAALGVYFIWGFTLLASTVAQRFTTPMVFLMYRFDAAALFMLLPVLFGRKSLRLNTKKIVPLIIMAICEPAVYFIGEQYGMKYTNSSFTGIFISIIPLFTMVLAAIFFNEKPTLMQWVFCVISICGVIAISVFTSDAGGNISFRGVVWLLIAVFSAGIYTILNKKAAHDNFGVYERTVVTLLVGAVFFTSGAVIENAGELGKLIAPAKNLPFVLAVIYVSLFASVIGYTLFNYAVANAPVANVISLNSLVTVLSVAAGVVFLDEPFSVKAGFAMAVVIIGIWGVQKFTRKEEIPETANTD